MIFVEGITQSTLVAAGNLSDFFRASIFVWVLLFALVGALIWAIVWLKARYWGHEDPAAADHQMLTQLGELRRNGDLSEEEYRSIKGRLVERLDGSPSLKRERRD